MVNINNDTKTTTSDWFTKAKLKYFNYFSYQNRIAIIKN